MQRERRSLSSEHAFPVYQTESGSLYTLDYKTELLRLSANGLHFSHLGTYVGVIDAQQIFQKVVQGSLKTYAFLLKKEKPQYTIVYLLGMLATPAGFMRNTPKLLAKASQKTLEDLLQSVLFKRAQPGQLLVGKGNSYNYTTPIKRRVL